MRTGRPIRWLPDEELLYGVWSRRGLDPRRLRTVDGARVQVVFPGRRNGGPGPDFLDASVHVEGLGLLRGDVEVHVRARDWMSHGHHRDPAYNGVVLHVVWDADSLWTERQDGEHVATVPVRGSMNTAEEGHSGSGDGARPPPTGGCPGVASSLGPGSLEEILDEAGDARFYAKSVRFQGEMAVQPPEEVLYQGLMRALGYSRNRDPFLALARLLPWSTLESLAASAPEEELPEILAASLLGTAGLLQAAAPALRARWRRSRLTREMGPSDWRLAGVRPANHPARRMEGAGQVLAQFAGEGLLKGFERALHLAARHRDPGLLAELAVARPAIGRDRAREVVVNVVLPFFHALGLDRGDDAPSRAASLLFPLAPPGRGNRKVRDMSAQLGIGKGLPVRLTARREQGLVHLVEGPCRHGWCRSCPLGRAAPGRAVMPAAS